MKTYYLNKIPAQQYKKLLIRPGINRQKSIEEVMPILNAVKKDGLKAALKYSRKYDGICGTDISVNIDEFQKAETIIPMKLKKAIKTAYNNIYKFHLPQKLEKYSVETMPGVLCQREFRPIENVGLYIPAGSAVLFSTLLMLAIPAKIAGCKRIVLCSPSKEGEVSSELLYTAKLCGINEFYKIGGAQAIALMAFGDKSIPPVNKIFGPGNQYVTAAKMLVSVDSCGCAIDMPAGPSEVLIIADKYADPSYIAADLLSQAEHGKDSQAVLIVTDDTVCCKVKDELEKQITSLPRKEEILSSLKASYILVAASVSEAIEFSNRYAPEHLILNVKDPDRYVKDVSNAGSVFLGCNTPESAGDYASGTNHSLPTYGYAKSYSGVSVEQFMKSVTFQKLSVKGLNNLAESVITMAEAEKLQAHANAIKVRLK